MEAEIILSYGDSRLARAVASAISPDNFKTPSGLSVETTCKDGEVVTRIVLEGKLATLIATIDDLLSCASTAEKTVAVTKRMT